MKQQLLQFMLRWFVNSLGLWIAAELLSGTINYENDFLIIALTGVVLSLINSILKPVVVILSLPLIVFSLGIFMIVVNGFMVWVAGALVPGFEVDTFGSAILAGLIVGLVNYALTSVMDAKDIEHGKPA